MLGDIYVYGKRTRQKTIVVSDQDLRNRDARYIVIEALEDKQHSTIAFNIDFAPRSSVMTASGRHKVEIIAAAMSSVDQKRGFLVHVSEQSGAAKQMSLNQNRASAIVSYMRLKKPILNRLLASKETSPALAERLQTESHESQNVFFERLRETNTLVGSAH